MNDHHVGCSKAKSREKYTKVMPNPAVSCHCNMPCNEMLACKFHTSGSTVLSSSDKAGEDDLLLIAGVFLCDWRTVGTKTLSLSVSNFSLRYSAQSSSPPLKTGWIYAF